MLFVPRDNKGCHHDDGYESDISTATAATGLPPDLISPNFAASPTARLVKASAAPDMWAPQEEEQQYYNTKNAALIAADETVDAGHNIQQQQQQASSTDTRNAADPHGAARSISSDMEEVLSERGSSHASTSQQQPRMAGSVTAARAHAQRTLASNRQKQQLWKINDALAQKNGTRQAVIWQKCVLPGDPLKTGTVDGKARWEPGIVYKGEWKENLKHGYGTQLWPNGNKYEGDWAFGRREGHGIFWTKAEGDGQVSSNKAKKKKKSAGRSTSSSAASPWQDTDSGSASARTRRRKKMQSRKLRKQYAGNWLRGQRHGVGMFYYVDGSRYEGNWEHGVRHGRGTMFWPNGDVYVGDWRDDKQNGFGTLTMANSDVYEGEWLNGKQEGPGIMYYRSKEKIYDGEWVSGTPQCGVYCDARAFFAQEGGGPVNDDLRRSRVDRLRQRPIPVLQLSDADMVLADRIDAIQTSRQAVRNLPFIALEQLFGEDGLDDMRRVYASFDENGENAVPAVQLSAMLQRIGFSDSLVAEDGGDSLVARVLVNLMKDAKSTINFSDFVKAAHLADSATRGAR